MGLFSGMVSALQGAFNGKRLKEELRSEALLGPTDQDAAGSFEPIEHESETSGTAPGTAGGPAANPDAMA